MKAKRILLIDPKTGDKTVEKITQYKILPKSYSNIIAGFDKLSDSELEEYGFYNVEPIEITHSDYNVRVHEKGALSYDADNKVFKFSKINKPLSSSLSDMKASKISSLKNVYNQKLSKTDWIIIRDKELGNSTEQTVLDARANLRSECDTKEGEINSLKSKQDVAKYILPNNL
tara:strand:+ start:15385 stop:15903 length:519 start_codon:yes stop_codon:yes gene_type:complete